MKTFLFLLFFCTNYIALQAQNKRALDSLQILYKNSTSDTSKILLLAQEIAFEYYRNRPDTAIFIAEKTLAWATKIKFEKGVAWSYNRIGISYYGTSNYPLALEYTQKGLVIFEKIGLKKGIAISLNNLGLIYMEQGNYVAALPCYTKALKLFEEVGIGTKRGIAISLRNTGRIYAFQQKYELALEYHLKSLKVQEEINDKVVLGVSFNEIAKIYITQKKYDLALAYALKSLQTHEVSKDKLGKAQSLLSLSIIYRQQQKYSQSIEVAQQSLQLAKEIKSGIQAKESNASLYETYKEMKEYDKALAYLELSKNINDSIFNIDKSKSIANIESKIALEKKEQAIKMLEKDNQLIKLSTENQSKLLAIAKKEAEANQEKSKRKADSLDALAQRTKLESDKLRAEDARLKAENKTQAVENQKQKEERDFQTKITYLISISFVIVLIFAFFIFQSRKKMSKAFRNLEEAKALLQQKKEEIEVQSEELQQTNDTLQKTVQFVNFQNKEINASVKYALQIQTAMLPILSDFEQIFPESFILFKPRDIVSGDFYWFAEVKKQGKSYTIVAVADCTGHGVPGAFLFMIGYNILNNLVKENRVTEPERILVLLDKKLRKTLQQDANKSKDGMDMQIISISKNIEQQVNEANTEVYFDKIDYAGAMNPLYYVENHVFYELKATKLPIGGGADIDKVFEKHTILLDKKSKKQTDRKSFILYLATDGFQDQFGGKDNRKFMTKRLRELLLTISDKQMPEQKEILENTITEWILLGEEEQTDDITIMGIRL